MRGQLWSKCVTPSWIPGDNSTKIRGTIPNSLPFDSNQLESINIQHFLCDYTWIIGEDHLHLSERCGGMLHGL
jgi:hypothetical protein